MPRYFNSRPREGANLAEFKHNALDSVFQFPPPRGGERLARNANNYFGIFQFPPPRGGEPNNYFGMMGSYISIPAPARGRTLELLDGLLSGSFQFPPPRGGERLVVNADRSFNDNFNSRPREGANFEDTNGAAFSDISIPAPARGRTSGIGGNRERVAHISIPAPARGRTSKFKCGTEI